MLSRAALLLCCSVLILHVERSFGIVPRVVSWQSTGNAVIITKNIRLSSNVQNCSILRDAWNRFYSDVIFGAILTNSNSSQTYDTVINKVVVKLESACDDFTEKLWPHENMNESYSIRTDIAQGTFVLSANQIWGVLHALTTLQQVIWRDVSGRLFALACTIQDRPRFVHRGQMIDTSRHFLPVPVIRQHLELMRLAKMNVLHWHIVDDQSFPYQSMRFPDLSDSGAFNAYTHVYTQNQIAQVLEFARVRGIRVVPEFDSPGHSASWGPGQPKLLTPCYSAAGRPDGSYGPINPTLNSTYAFMTELMREISHVFRDRLMHLGGDEVPFGCWKSNPFVMRFMQEKGWGSDMARLQQFYINRVMQIVQKVAPANAGKSSVVWQEVFDNNNKIPKDTSIVHVWKSPWKKEISQVTKSGYKTLLSSCWYLNYINYGVDWHPFYTCDPHDFEGTDAQKSLVIGGETCMWGEYVDAANFISRTWPRSAAVAERLWSPASVRDIGNFAKRIGQFRCQILRYGLNGETMNGPGTYCEQEPGVGFEE